MLTLILTTLIALGLVGLIEAYRDHRRYVERMARKVKDINVYNVSKYYGGRKSQ